MSLAIDADQTNAADLITHFNETTKFSLAQIDKLTAPKPPETKGLDVVTVSKAGEDFDLAGCLAENKLTIVEFYADWCVPCKVLEKKLISYMNQHGGIALRKVNIVDWQSEAAKKHLKGVDGIPYVIIFDASGKESYRGTGDFESTIKALQTQSTPPLAPPPDHQNPAPAHLDRQSSHHRN